MEENKVNEIQAEETQNQNIEPTPAEQNVAEENAAENTTPAAEPVAEAATAESAPVAEAAPAEAKAEAAPVAPAAKRVVKKAPAKGAKTSFGKIFLAVASVFAEIHTAKVRLGADAAKAGGEGVGGSEQGTTVEDYAVFNFCSSTAIRRLI